MSSKSKPVALPSSNTGRRRKGRDLRAAQIVEKYLLARATIAFDAVVAFAAFRAPTFQTDERQTRSFARGHRN